MAHKKKPSFYEVVNAACDDIADKGFDSEKRIEAWTEKIRAAAEDMLLKPADMEDLLRDSLSQIYKRLIDKGQIANFHPGVSRFTINNLKPKLRAELDRRIMASAQLIKLNRKASIEKTLQRFAGWSTSIPKGGAAPGQKGPAKVEIKKAMQSLPFEERRVLIDQGHKFTSALNDIIATDGGAIAAIWHSHWRQRGYNYRHNHKERDQKVYLIRNSWAHKKGLVNPGDVGFSDKITQPGEEVYCFPGDSKVPFANGVDRGYRRWYSGELTTIITASGKTLRATPNHPVLTSKGWVAIGALDEGDDVIEVHGQIFDPPEKNKDDPIPTLAEIFSALEEQGITQVRRGNFEQFHGDGTNGDINVVDSAALLSFWAKSGSRQGFSNFLFPMSRYARLMARSFLFRFIGLFFASKGVMGGLCQFAATFLPNSFHSDEVCFRSISERDTKMLGKRSSRNPKPIREAEKAFPFKITSTRIVSIERRKWSGHVYNLQTADGQYIVDGIIVHNCRCYYQYVYSISELPSDMLTTKGKDALKEARRKIKEMA